MTIFSVLLLALLAGLLLAVSGCIVQLGRQAEATEAVAEAVGTLADAKVSETKRDAALVMVAVEEAERLAREEEKTKPDHPNPLLAPCSRCGATMSLCRCPPVRS